MKMTFRWYGPSDSISIESIAQIPAVEGVVSAVYGVPVGEVWSEEAILTLKNTANAHLERVSAVLFFLKNIWRY